MAFARDIQQQLARNPYAMGTIAGTWPQWEQVTPQYPFPNAYSLALNGYRKNEIVFACIQRRAAMTSEAQLKIYTKGDDRQELPDHPLKKLLKRPNSAMSEVDLWQVVSIYADIAGHSTWEVEFNRIGEPINLWPMRPDYCSFMRGENKPLAKVRYLYPGFEPFEIPIERIFNVMEFDPIYPLLKPLSRTMIALRVSAVDNAATDFLKSFFDHGTMTNIVLTTDQSLQDPEAQRMQERYMEQHGGAGNWARPVVLGKGTTAQNVGMNFKDMAFPEIDGRDEVRICMIFDVDPIVISAKIGMGTITENNKKEALRGMYQQVISPRWSWLANKVKAQLLPFFEDEPDNFDVEFDTSEVVGMQEDKDAKWTRAVNGFKTRIITRNDALEEMGLDRLETPDGDAYYENVNVRSDEPVSAEGEPEALPAENVPPFDQAVLEQAKNAERRNFRAFVRKRLKEKREADIDAFKFTVLPPTEQAALKSELGLKPEPTAADVIAEIRAARQVIEHV